MRHGTAPHTRQLFNTKLKHVIAMEYEARDGTTHTVWLAMLLFQNLHRLSNTLGLQLAIFTSVGNALPQCINQVLSPGC